MADVKHWQPGDVVAFRWMVNGRVMIAQANLVVKDTPEETALLILPGAKSVKPDGLWDSAERRWDRWAVQRDDQWVLRPSAWRTNRVLMVVRPGDWYSVMYFWPEATGVFDCYYVNFQLPLKRTPVGFDSFDLELDLVMEPGGRWHWKDEDDYRLGIAAGFILPEWSAQIDRAKESLFAQMAARAYPFDGTWINYQPPAHWAPPSLPAGWNDIT
jgi:Protein of unknown function (DUF402)